MDSLLADSLIKDLKTSKEDKSPSVSIVIPVRNEERYIETCLKSVFDQDYLNIIQILVVDGCFWGNNQVLGVKMGWLGKIGEIFLWIFVEKFGKVCKSWGVF